MSDAEDKAPRGAGQAQNQSGGKKAKGAGLPSVEGDEDVGSFVNKYKKTLLNKRGLLKDAKEGCKRRSVYKPQVPNQKFIHYMCC